MKVICFLCAFLISFLAIAKKIDTKDLDHIPFNQIQVIGTHNSYHRMPSKKVFKIIKENNQDFALSIEYTHPCLYKQLDELGVRHIELDIFEDRVGGHYSKRNILEILGKNPMSSYIKMYQPGYKVFHVQDIDFRSRCLTFKTCLQQVKHWSDKNQGHFPVSILIELKYARLNPVGALQFQVPLYPNKKTVDSVDEEILAVFPREQIITPSDLMVGGEMLEQSIQKHGWPLLKALRGKILFILDNMDIVRSLYLKDSSFLKERVMFVFSSEGSSYAAFMKYNDPSSNKDSIKHYVNKGYIIRTRADNDTIQARVGDYRQKDIAFASGAQIISTDYIRSQNRFGTDYQVIFNHKKTVRKNPVIYLSQK